MSPEDVKALRTRLRATTKDLAHALGVDPSIVTDWERGEQFPTKQYVDKMTELERRGADALPRAPGRRASPRKREPIAMLSDPEVWRIIRKILVHADLRQAVLELAARYEDPAADD